MGGNIAINLAITTFVTPGKRGIHFKRTEAPDVRTVGIAAVLIGVCTLVALATRAPMHPTVPEQALLCLDKRAKSVIRLG